MSLARKSAIFLTWFLISMGAMGNATDPIPAQRSAESTRQQVESVVGRDLRLDAGLVSQKLEMLMPVEHLTMYLRVLSVKRDFAPNSWLLRLGCGDSHCMAFAALLHDTVLTASNWRDLPPERPSLELDSAKHRLNPPVAPVVHKGDNVSVIEEFAQVKLLMKAVSLDSGEVGDTIRVRNASSHRVVKATVVAAGRAWVQAER